MRKLLLLFFLLLPVCAYGATTTSLVIIPSKSIVRVGESVDVTISASSLEQSMNAVSGAVALPANITVASISTDGSIVNFWTEQPHVLGNRIQFEGVVLNPGYQGTAGKLFTATFVGKKPGTVTLSFTNGAILANDGLGSNILEMLGTAKLSVADWSTAPIAINPSTTPTRVALLPVITEYSPIIDARAALYLKGKGEPDAQTKIVFRDQSIKSLGERFIALLQTKKKKLNEIIVQNDSSGGFAYYSPNNLVAGAYNATPYLVDPVNNSDKAGIAVHVLVSDSKIVHWLVVLINILVLLIPIVGLLVLIYFIPWYSRRRMILLKEKLHLEEEKIHLSEHKLLHEEKLIDEK